MFSKKNCTILNKLKCTKKNLCLKLVYPIYIFRIITFLLSSTAVVFQIFDRPSFAAADGESFLKNIN